MTKKQSRPRTSAPPHTWDLRVLYAGDDDPRIAAEIRAVEKATRTFIERWKKRNDWLRDPVVLKRALDEYEAWKRRYGTDGNAGYYYWLRTQIDRNNTDLKARTNKVEETGRRLWNEIQFFTLGIARIPKSRRKAFLDHPALRRYRHFLELIFQESAYLLSDAEEKIMNLKAQTSYGNWVRMTSDFLSREEREVLLEEGGTAKKTKEEILSLMNSRTKKVRDRAAAAFNDILARNADIAEVELNSVLANKKVDDELRRIPRPDLPRHLADDIDTAVVDALRSAVSSRYDISSRFYQLKARLLRVRKLKYHERNIEYGSVTKKYPFPRALNLVRRVMEGLDGEFLAILDDFAERRRFDVFPRRGKSGGAFCVHHLLTQPTFIMLNHTNTLHDVLTLAHELGHGINNELIRKKQHSLDFGTPTSTAEVASTFMEDFVLREILKTADDETRLSILMTKLNDDVSTIFRQIACYDFESELHHLFRRMGYLSQTEIGRLFQKHMAAYMGQAVEQSPGSENWWVYWSHIRSFFYVYSYAGGLLISKSLQHAVRRDASFIRKVKDFLGAGLSESPRAIFDRLGIDIGDSGFWKQGLAEVDELLGETEELARRLGKFGKRR